MDLTSIALSVSVIALSGVTVYLKSKTASKNELIADVKNQALMLFLYAEKQDWVNKQKMTWCVQQMYVKFPSIIKKIIKEEPLEIWMQSLYDEFKTWIKQ